MADVAKIAYVEWARCCDKSSMMTKKITTSLRDMRIEVENDVFDVFQMLTSERESSGANMAREKRIMAENIPLDFAVIVVEVCECEGGEMATLMELCRDHSIPYLHITTAGQLQGLQFASLEKLQKEFMEMRKEKMLECVAGADNDEVYGDFGFDCEDVERDVPGGDLLSTSPVPTQYLLHYFQVPMN